MENTPLHYTHRSRGEWQTDPGASVARTHIKHRPLSGAHQPSGVPHLPLGEGVTTRSAPAGTCVGASLPRMSCDR